MQIQSAMPISPPPTSTPELPENNAVDFASVLSSHTEHLTASIANERADRSSDSSSSSEDISTDTSKSASETELANAASGSATQQVAPLADAQPDAELTASVLEAIEVPAGAAATISLDSTVLAASEVVEAPSALSMTTPNAEQLEALDGLTQAPAAQISAPFAPVAEGDVAGVGNVDLSSLEGASITATPAPKAAPTVDAPDAPVETITVTVAPELSAAKPADDSVTQDLAKVLHGPIQPAATANVSADANSSAADAADSDAKTPAQPVANSVDAADGAVAAKHSEAFSVAASSDVRPTSQTRAAVTENIRSEVWAIAQRAQNLARVEAVMQTAFGDLSVVARHTANGVQVTLAGDAAANLDLASLQGQLPGLDVSVDLSQQSRALEWEPDTVVPRAPSSAPQIVSTPSLRSAQSQLDVLA